MCKDGKHTWQFQQQPQSGDQCLCGRMRYVTAHGWAATKEAKE